MKNINKFTKLAVLFTLIYLLIGLSIPSDKWAPKIYIADLSIVGFLFVLSMALSVVLGVISIKKTTKAEKWLLILLTIFNLSMLGSSIIAWVGHFQV